MNKAGFAIDFLASRRLSVFLFHKVPVAADPIVAGDLDLASFGRTLDFIGDQFKVVPLDDAVAALQRGKLPPRSACITFDDGYPDWASGVVPALTRHNFHATFFITSEQFTGLPMWHERVARAIKLAPGPVLALPRLGIGSVPLATLQDRQRACSLLESFLKYQTLATREALLECLEAAAGVRSEDVPRMAAADLRALHSKGFGVGAHTVHHPILSLCTHAEAAHEIGAVREELSSIVGGAVNAFAYPNGRPVSDFNADHVKMVQSAGYRYAVTTQWGWADQNTPVFQIPRFTPWGPSHSQMSLQLARNLLTKPRLLVPAVAPVQPIRVLIVENGAGFGGAVVALQTLLSNMPADRVACNVVSNFHVGDFSGLASVATHAVIADHLFNFRSLSRQVQTLPLGIVGKLLLFVIGRLDDIFNRLPYLVRLAASVIKLKPDIMHGNNEPNSNREAMLVAKLLRIPYVQHLRGPLGMSRHTPWLLSKPDMFVPVSRWLATDLLASGVVSGKVRQVYDAVDLTALRNKPESSSLRKSLAIPKDTMVVAMVGMLVPWKGQQLFVEAVKLLSTQDKKVIFLLVGGTPERNSSEYEILLRKLVAEAGLEEKIIFLGQRADVPALLPEIDIVVSTSLKPEPLGLVMLEAMASNCIFIGPSHGAATEVVQDGKNGFLFTPGSAQSLADKFAEAIAMADNREQLTQTAQQNVSRQFAGANCAMATFAIYESIFQGIKKYSGN